MLKVHDYPLDQHKLTDLDLQCFPDLFPYGENGQKEYRKSRLTDFMYIKHLLLSKHAQFRTNIQYLFYALNDNNRRQLNAGIFSKLNITNVREK